MKTPTRQKAARKAARTRAVNKAAWERWEKMDRPALMMIDRLITRLATQEEITVQWARGTDARLKNDVEYGRLIRSLHGGKIWRVLPEGYRRPHDYHASMWRLLL
jgi:hypothetical protein